MGFYSKEKWPAATLAAGEQLTLTVLAQVTDPLVIITTTVPMTDWVDLRGAVITSTVNLTTSNLGASEANQTSFVLEGLIEPQGTIFSTFLPLVTRNATGNSLVSPASGSSGSPEGVIAGDNSTVPADVQAVPTAQQLPTSPPSLRNWWRPLLTSLAAAWQWFFRGP